MIHEKIQIQTPGSGCQADLYTYFLDNSPEIDPERIRPVVLICPGGGYEMTSDREAEGTAVRFLAMGFHAAVLRYSVAPARFPEALLQLAGAVRLLRANAAEWHIDPKRIIVQGSSAGGHLAASLGVFWNRPFLAEILGFPSESFRPDGMILSYPVITSGEFSHEGSFRSLLGADYEDAEKRKAMSLEYFVREDTPPAFLWHTATDAVVPVENSLMFFSALHSKGVLAELHIFPEGPHGLGLADEETNPRGGIMVREQCKAWISLAGEWLRHL